LLVLDTRDTVDSGVPDSIHSMATLGKQQYETYVHERLETNSKSVMDTIKQNTFTFYIWDRYVRNSLKEAARQKRGVGVRRSISPDTMIPCNLDSFLRHSRLLLGTIS
jgi:hypothetical protein